MSRRHTEDMSVGEDSFLDTTANLVGILIILVVIVGAKTKVEAEAYGRGLVEDDRAEELEEPLQKAQALEQSLVQQAVNIAEYELETEYRRLERNAILEKVVLARQQADEKLSSLNSKQRDAVQQDQLIHRLQSEIEAAIQEKGVDTAADRPEIVLEHLPTPMARTVFQKEVHLMLRQGKVTVVPWDRLVDVLKQQIPLTAQRQASRNALEDTVGPVGGFLMRYRMASIPGGFELDRFELEPTSAIPAESLDDALRDTSRLGIELASRNPRETVVTVWVYPDSFDDFRKLKAGLFSTGFLCAARPLPDNVRIGASPRGTRSSAQ
jgi:hypothetical protein